MISAFAPSLQGKGWYRSKVFLRKSMNEDWLLIEAPNSGVEHYTIQECVTHETRLIQQSHGPGRFAIVALTLTPNSTQIGVRFKQTLTLGLDKELFVRC